MVFIATLRGIFRFSELTEELGPYVQFKATIEKRDEVIPEDVKIAILKISGTTSYHVLFLDSYNSIDEIVAELKESDAKINHATLKILERNL